MSKYLIPFCVSAYVLCGLIASGHFMAKPCDENPIRCEERMVVGGMGIFFVWPFYASYELQRDKQ